MHERAQFELNSKRGADLAVNLLGSFSTTLTYKNFVQPTVPMVPRVFLILGRLGNSRNRQADSRSY